MVPNNPLSGSLSTSSSRGQTQASDDSGPSGPSDPPPPYTEIADPGSEITTDANFQRPYVALNQHIQPTQIQSSDSGPISSQSFSTVPQMPQRPPQPPERQSEPSTYPTRSSNGKQSSSSYPGTISSTYPQWNNFSPPETNQRLQGPPNVPWTYPEGYWCPKCRNTGIKIKNGLSCQDCYGRFAKQHANIYNNSYYNQGPISTPWYGGLHSTSQRFVPASSPPIVVSPGDPRIGGILCGRCRGRGTIYDLLGSFTCTTCRGVGRLF